MIRLGGMVTLKPLREAEDDKYVSIGFGKYKEKGKEDDSSAPTFKKTDAGKFVATKSDSKAGAKKPVPKVNIFDKPAEEPKKAEPAQSSEPKKIRQGNPQVNKATKKKAEELGITPDKLGKDEYQKKMAQAAYEALTDSNFHSEARELIAKLEGKPELAEKPDYPSMKDPKFKEKMAAIRTKYASEYSDNVEDDARDLGVSASQESGWSGDDAVAGIAFTLRMNGFHKLADTIQSVIKESKSTRLTSMLKEAKKYDIGSGWMGNGLTIWNRAEEQYGDYKIIAHISKDGTLSIRDKQLPNDIKKMFQMWADTMKKGGRPGTY